MRTLQVPDDLYVQLEQASHRHGRSLREYVLELLAEAVEHDKPAERRSLLELDGLGREIWQGVDVDAYIAAERDSWDRG